MDHEYRASVLAEEIGIDSDGALKTPSELRAAVRERLAAIKAERDEDDIALQVVRVRLGGEEREVGLLPIKRDREWRRRLARLINEAIDYIATMDLGEVSETNAKTGKTITRRRTVNDMHMIEGYKLAVDYCLIDGIDAVVDLFFAYSGFDREDIEATATSLEIYTAAIKVFEVYTVPFVQRMLPMLTALRRIQGAT